MSASKICGGVYSTSLPVGGTSMSRYKLGARLTILFLGVISLAAAVSGCSQAPSDVVLEPANTTYYEGARVLVGNGEVIEDAVFSVVDGVFAAVGSSNAVDLPSGVSAVDLRGKTVMPAIVDAHVHLSTSRDALTQDLRRRAEQGISAALSLGSDGEDVPLEMRDELMPGAARYLSAGRGITMPEPGRTEVPHWVTSEAQARQAVRDEAARDVNFIKIWVDDRNGQYEKLSAELYSAIIDEAHQHNLKVFAHIFALEDAKGLLRAGIDVFAHGVRDQDIDDEFVALIRQRPEVILVPNLPSRGVPTDLSWLATSMSAEELMQLQAGNVERLEVQAAHGIQARNLARLSAAGMTIAMGTDGNTFWAPHVEMEDMVAAGMAAADVIVSATQNSANAVGLDDTGTIQTGKRADFIVLDANPLEAIENTRRISAVYLAGGLVDRSGR